jgi:hypothetical protein
MAEVSRGWDELEEWERDEWRKRARQLRIRVRRQVAYANQQKARTRALRPQEFYVKINRVLGVCGYERRRLPPPEPKFGPNPLKPELEASLVKGRLVLKLVLRAAPVNDIMVFGSPPRRAGQEPGGNYAFLGLLPPPKGRKSNISEMYLTKLEEWRSIKNRQHQVPLEGARISIRTWSQVNGWEDRGSMMISHGLVRWTG